MSRNFKLTQEEINKVLMRSPYALPSSPGQAGLDATQIKKYFYDFIRLLADSLNVHFEDINLSMSELDEVINQINERLNTQGGENGDTGEESDGTGGENGTSAEALEEHNTSQSAHSDIRDEINVVRAIGNQALNIARGKNRIQLFATIEKMFNFIDIHRYYEDHGYASYESIEEGDIFVIAQKNVPEFAVLSLSRYEDENTQDITENDIGTREFLAGGIYYYAKKDITLVGIEGGADTSSIIDVSQVQQEISKHNESTLAHSDIRAEILQKQDKLKAGNNITISDDGTISATLEVNADGTIDVSSKLDKVTSVTELPQAYIKNADGTQGLIGIAVSNFAPNEEVLVTGKVVVNEIESVVGLVNNCYSTKEELANKQDKLTFDNKPTNGSTNPVTSEGIAKEFYEFSTAYDKIIEEAKTEIKEYTDSQLVNKQDKLTAGDNITIGEDGTISAMVGSKELTLLKDITLEENVATLNVTFDKRVKEIFICAYFGVDLTDSASKILKVKTDGGLQYFVYQTMSFDNSKKNWFCHAKEVAERWWETIFQNARFTNTQGTEPQNARLGTSYRDPDKQGFGQRYVGGLVIEVDGVNLLQGSNFKIYGREVEE